jgi:hypothetical protein
VSETLERVEENFRNYLLRLNFIYKNRSITTKCIKDHPGVPLLGETYGPYQKGKEYNLKFFTALPFIKNGYLKVNEIEKCDNVDVMNYAIEEGDNESLIRRENKYFLNKIKEFRYFMEKEVEKKFRPEVELKRYKSYQASIIDSRLSKLLRLAKVDLSLNDEQKLTNSEIGLFNQFSRKIKIWRDFFLNR